MRAIFLGIVFAFSATGMAAAASPLQAECDTIIANQNNSRAAKIEAALLYYHGMRMGKKCVKVDYYRALVMLREAGDDRNYMSLLKDLVDKANAGSPKALAALKKLNPGLD